MPGAATLTGLPPAPSLITQLPSRDESSDSEGNQNGPDADDGFTQVKLKRKQPRKRKFITGSGGAGTNSLSGVEPNRHLFIAGVHPDTEDDHLKSWIVDKLQVDLKHFEKLQPSPNRAPGSASLSFRVTVPLSDWDTVLKPESWPNGIRVRQFFPARTGTFKV